MKKTTRCRVYFALAYLFVLHQGLAQAQDVEPVTGPTMAEVTFGDDTGTQGFFVHVGDKNWNRLNPDRSIVSGFVEYGRDDWSVYLKDASGDTSVHVNLWTKTVTQQSGGSKATLGKVLGAANTVTATTPTPAPVAVKAQTTEPVTGPTVAEVTFGDDTGTEGFFVHVGDKNWNRLNPDRSIVSGFAEYGRDDWSVYLKDASGDTSVHVDLWTKTVTQQSGPTKTTLGKVLGAANTLTATTTDQDLSRLSARGKSLPKRPHPTFSKVQSTGVSPRNKLGPKVMADTPSSRVKGRIGTKQVIPNKGKLRTTGLLRQKTQSQPGRGLTHPDTEPADSADQGVLTFEVPPVVCAPGEQVNATADLCVREVEFYSQDNLTLQQAKDIAAERHWALATEDEVVAAWTDLNLDVSAYGMMSDGRFAVPVQSDHSNFKSGHNVGATGGNQGFLYTLKQSIPRGVGTIPLDTIKQTCPADRDYDTGLCFRRCPDGFTANGLSCVRTKDTGNSH